MNCRQRPLQVFDRSRRLQAAALLNAVVAMTSGCGPLGDTGNGGGGSTALAVRVPVDDLTVPVGAEVSLSAYASGGTAPRTFRWDQNAGPVDTVLDDVTGATMNVGNLEAPGRYVFRVVVTDQDFRTATEFVVVNVTEVDLRAQRRFVLTDRPVRLEADVSSEDAAAAILWIVATGDASIDGPNTATPLLTVRAAETVRVELTASFAVGDEEPVVVKSFADLVAAETEFPIVRIETDFGDIDVELNGEAAPLHTAHFLQYVDDGYYDGLLFHRNACTPDEETEECTPFVLQGGGYERAGGELVLRETTRDPVPSEADNGLSNSLAFSVAMALSGGNPDSGNTQFFLNLGDNGSLDDQDFTVFGRVVDGTDVVDTIVEQETMESTIIAGETSQPVEDVEINRIIRKMPG